MRECAREWVSESESESEGEGEGEGESVRESESESEGESQHGLLQGVCSPLSETNLSHKMH